MCAKKDTKHEKNNESESGEEPGKKYWLEVSEVRQAG